MYSRKSAGPRMEPLGTQLLINLKFLWGLSSQNDSKPSITEKRRSKTKYLS